MGIGRAPARARPRVRNPAPEERGSGPDSASRVMRGARVRAPPNSAMPIYTVRGAFYARRAYWQPFTKRHDAESPEQAREWALSEIGGCHGVKRQRIRIDEVSETPPP
jgi:ribosomal protein L20A (L18A)